MTTKIRILISGPGETHSAPIYGLTQALKYLGFDIEIEDEYPADEAKQKAQWESLEGHWNRAANPEVLRVYGPNVAHIKVEHLPWGG